VTSTDDTVGNGLASMAVYGAIGIALQGVFLLVLEHGLKSDLDSVLRAERLEPLAVTIAAGSVALGVVCAVAVS
jgi:hypothetical protein